MRLRSGLVSVALMLSLAITTVNAGGSTGPSVEGIQPIVVTHDDALDMGQRYALAVIAEDFDGRTHAASSGYYSNPWIRDSFAWGMIPSTQGASLAAYPTSEVQYWLAHQQRFGGWLTAPKSGYFDETPIMISAVLSAFQLSGNRSALLDALTAVEHAWSWLDKSYVNKSEGSDFLLYANVPPHVAADWVDQIARRGYTTQLEALWYKATVDLSHIEVLTGHRSKAATYARFAAQIKKEINRILWTSAAPFAYHVPAVAPFGHYRSWRGPRDYFELDSNFLCILYGIADTQQTSSIVKFVLQHRGYLLGLKAAQGVPARVLYGDYAPADYAWKRNRIGQEQYQNAYWPSVGALVALGLFKAGNGALARLLLERIGDSAVAQGDIREWYKADGTGEGAPHFQWAARMFLIAILTVTT